MPNKTLVAIGALLAIAISCIFKNIDGLLIGAICTIIGGLGGFALGKVKK